MQMVKIPDLEYIEYEIIADTIFKTIPFAIIECQYRKNLKAGFFNFWDSDYIPESMKKFIVQPPLSRENKELLKSELDKVIRLKE